MKDDTLLTLMMDCIKTFPAVKAAYKHEFEEAINPAYTDIEHCSSVCLNEKRIWALRGDLTLAVGIKNNHVRSGNTSLFYKIDKSMHPYISRNDRYGHPSLAMPESGYDGSVYYAGWFNQYPDCIMVLMSTGRYQNTKLTPLQKQFLDHYISIIFMKAYGEQNIIFMDYTTDAAFYSFIKNQSPHEKILKRVHTPASIKKNSLMLVINYLSIDKLFFNELDTIIAGTFADIHLVTQYGQLAFLKALVNENPELVNALNQDNQTPLQLAAEYEHVEIVRFLIAQGADLNISTVTTTDNYPNKITRNMTAIDLALQNEEHEIVLLLLDAGAKVAPAVNGQLHCIHVMAKFGSLTRIKSMLDTDPGLLEMLDEWSQTPLLWAASRGHKDCVDYLLAQGANIHVQTQVPAGTRIIPQSLDYSPLDWVINRGHTETAASLIKAGAIAQHTHRTFNGQSITDMVMDGNLAGIRILIHHNKALLNEIDQNGNTPLMVAIWFDKTEIVHYLISEKADPNIGASVGVGCGDQTNQDVTPLELALIKHNEAIAILLNTAGAKTSPAVNGQFHVVHLFAQQGWLKNIATLLENNPELVNIVDDTNKTPLLWAYEMGNQKIVDYLIAQGADVNVGYQDRSGETCSP